MQHHARVNAFRDGEAGHCDLDKNPKLVEADRKKWYAYDNVLKQKVIFCL